MRGESANEPVAESRKNEADYVAARGSHDRTDAAVKAGEHGCADCTEQNVDAYGGGAALAAQTEQRHENAEGLERKRNGKHGDAYPCAHRHHCRKYCDQNEIPCSKALFLRHKTTSAE